jgi:hypothetical protein
MDTLMIDVAGDGGATITEAAFMVGDVIQLKGAGVPKVLEPAFWRVTGFQANANGGTPAVELSGPWKDECCTERFR